jgi:hypothetical protein
MVGKVLEDEAGLDKEWEIFLREWRPGAQCNRLFRILIRSDTHVGIAIASMRGMKTLPPAPETRNHLSS